MSIFNLLNAALYSKLTGASGLTSLLASGTAVYYLQAPDDAPLPYVVYSAQAGGDDNLTPSRMKNMVYFIRGYSKTSPANAGTIDAQVDAAIHGVTLTVAGWANFWTAREQDVAAVETTASGAKIYMAGGMYRIRLDS